jgi:hypothetical protein
MTRSALRIATHAAALALVITAAAPAQITVAPGFQTSILASGIPGARHQVAVEASGAIWVSEESASGFGGGAMHRVVAGVLTPNVLPFIAAPGQMLRNPGDGLVYFVHHWSGALDHNHLTRIEANGTSTVLTDVLWGVGHGLMLDTGGTFYIGTSPSPFGAAAVHQIPNPPGSVTPIAWHAGVADNGHLVWSGANAAFVASALPGPGTVTRIDPAQPDQTAFTYSPLFAGSTVTIRGLVANPFGAGWLASVVEHDPVSNTVTGSIHYFGPGGPYVLATAAPAPPPGDFAINDDGTGGLLIVDGGSVLRLFAAAPPVPPGTLTAPASAMQGTPVIVTIAGRPMSIAPMIFAADLPLGPPTFPLGVLPIAPYGFAHTSLGLQPSFVALEDGIPVFAPAPTPAGFLPPSGARSLAYVVPPVASPITVVLQAYVLDAAAPNGLFWITNPAFVTLTP